MLKKAIAFVAMLTLLASIIVLPPGQTAEAAGANFFFPNESDNPASARTTTDEMVTLQGTITNVDPNNITYSIYQVVDAKNMSDPADDVFGSKKENVSNNIYISGQSMQVFNLQLFPGLNKITFKGLQGMGEVTDTIYIDYRDSPVLFDLVAGIDGNQFPIKEDEPTVVYSTASRGQSTANISITGRAPNASDVTVVVNGMSYTYPVNSSSNWLFTVSPVNLTQGKNLVTLKVKNATQTVETTREVAFYNGSVTYYDAQIFKDYSTSAATTNDNDKLDLGENAASLSYYPNFAVNNPITDASNNLKIYGRLIVPNAYYSNLPHPNPLDPTTAMPTYSIKRGSTTIVPTKPITLTLTSSVTHATYEQDPFYEFEYVIDLAADIAANAGGSATDDFDYDTMYEVVLQAENAENVRLGIGDQIEGTSPGELMFSLRNNSQAYIHDINYIPGYAPPYTNTQMDNLTGMDMENASVFNVPIGVEVLIANPDALYPASNEYIDQIVRITSITDSNGNTYSTNGTDFAYTINKYPNATRLKPIVTKTVNGVTQSYLRVIFEITKLPRTGLQTINFQLNPDWTRVNATTSAVINADNTAVSPEIKSIPITLVYGPYVQFLGLYDGMQQLIDTTDGNWRTTLVDTIFKDFEGEIRNVANAGNIRYTDNSPILRTMYFYINNTQVDINTTVPASPNHNVFRMTAAEQDKAEDALLTGENIFTFEFRTNKDTYQKKFRVNLVPTNLPVIPAPGTSGVFPYSVNSTTPNPNDPNFQLNGAVYTTKQGSMNVYGSFDFIDLGKTHAAVEAKITTPATKMTDAEKQKYKLVIQSPGQPTIEWDLTNRFTSTTGTNTYNSTIANSRLSVTYDYDKQHFFFNLTNETIPADGSSRIFNIYVYNNGTSGPRASYRLEVNPTSIPFTVVRPLLPQKRITNSNYVELIIHSEGADKLTVGKEEATKIDFDANNDGTIDYRGAFKIVVNNLKANRDNEIEFTITRGEDEIEDSVVVRYEPTNIPGAQYMEDMKNSHKIFEGALNLTFERGTTLIRKDYNSTDTLKNQIFTGHRLLFAVANPEDGVVDRREFETLPANFDSVLNSFGARFRASFPQRFIKASSVYWIDPGMADNPGTPTYDPLKTGALPYQFPSSGIPSYDDRPASRELIPSKRGTLTLSFDPSIRNMAGVSVTVLRYNQVLKYWENLGGQVDEKKKTITVPFDKFGYYVVAKQSYSFTDITQHPYGRNFMDAIYSKGIMNPISFGEFGTDYYVTRGEFATMVVKALNIPLDYEVGRGHFDDVPFITNPEALWDYRYIETAARAGIISGTLPRVFEPNNYLTREQASYILAIALDMKLDTDMTKVTKNLEKSFKDSKNIAYYFQSAVAAIAKEGFIKGSPVDPADPKAGFSFEPKSRLTRADAAIILARVMEDQDKLPPIN